MVRKDAIRRTRKRKVFSKDGKRPCLICRRIFTGKVGDCWCPHCWPIAEKAGEGSDIWNDTTAAPVPVQGFDVDIVDENNRVVRAGELAAKYRRELLRRREADEEA